MNIHHIGVKHHNKRMVTIKLELERENLDDILYLDSKFWSDEVDHGCMVQQGLHFIRCIA